MTSPPPIRDTDPEEGSGAAGPCSGWPSVGSADRGACTLQEHQLLYDRVDGVNGGELLHAYTPVLSPGFYIELLERRGRDDGYGSANTHVRLAAQAHSTPPPPLLRELVPSGRG